MGYFAMRQFYAFFSLQLKFVPQHVGQTPWGRPLMHKEGCQCLI